MPNLVGRACRTCYCLLFLAAATACGSAGPTAPPELPTNSVDRATTSGREPGMTAKHASAGTNIWWRSP